jgi:hypothetical protein
MNFFFVGKLCMYNIEENFEILTKQKIYNVIFFFFFSSRF